MVIRFLQAIKYHKQTKNCSQSTKRIGNSKWKILSQVLYPWNISNTSPFWAMVILLYRQHSLGLLIKSSMKYTRLENSVPSAGLSCRKIMENYGKAVVLRATKDRSKVKMWRQTLHCFRCGYRSAQPKSCQQPAEKKKWHWIGDGSCSILQTKGILHTLSSKRKPPCFQSSFMIFEKEK